MPCSPLQRICRSSAQWIRSVQPVLQYGMESAVESGRWIDEAAAMCGSTTAVLLPQTVPFHLIALSRERKRMHPGRCRHRVRRHRALRQPRANLRRGAGEHGPSRRRFRSLVAPGFGVRSVGGPRGLPCVTPHFDGCLQRPPAELQTLPLAVGGGAGGPHRPRNGNGADRQARGADQGQHVGL